MNIIRYKTWYDIWENKGRTLQIVLVIAIVVWMMDYLSARIREAIY